MLALSLVLPAGGASAITIELQDVASDRIERQIAAAEGRLPLPGTPDIGHFSERLAAKGLQLGAPVFIRVFKAESELEVWIAKDGRFEHFATYPVCQWSGTIGPKTQAGDKQTPEGFYTITRRRLHRSARHPRALNLGFPNPFDQSLERTGDYILVHGGCASIGCFAMTDTVVEEIFTLAQAAIRKGRQDNVPIHVFPFRMTEANLAAHADSPWLAFWRNLKDGFDAFETTRVPPRVGVCDKRYVFQTLAAGEVKTSGPLVGCGAMMAARRARERLSVAAGTAAPPLPTRPVPETATTAQMTPSREAVDAPLPVDAASRPSDPSQASARSSPATRCSEARADCVRADAAERTAAGRRDVPPVPGRMSLGAR